MKGFGGDDVSFGPRAARAVGQGRFQFKPVALHEGFGFGASLLKERAQAVARVTQERLSQRLAQIETQPLNLPRTPPPNRAAREEPLPRSSHVPLTVPTPVQSLVQPPAQSPVQSPIQSPVQSPAQSPVPPTLRATAHASAPFRSPSQTQLSSAPFPPSAFSSLGAGRDPALADLTPEMAREVEAWRAQIQGETQGAFPGLVAFQGSGEVLREPLPALTALPVPREVAFCAWAFDLLCATGVVFAVVTALRSLFLSQGDAAVATVRETFGAAVPWLSHMGKTQMTFALMVAGTLFCVWLLNVVSVLVLGSTLGRFLVGVRLARGQSRAWAAPIVALCETLTCGGLVGLPLALAVPTRYPFLPWIRLELKS